MNSTSREAIGDQMLANVVKASQSLSGEIQLSKLIERLMKIAIENAAADRGVLILPSRNEYLIHAVAVATGDQIEVTMRQEPMTPVVCPESLVRHVIRTRQNVILDDASKPNQFSGDDYLRKQQSKSILCLPLIKQRELTGILLLENTLASYAFTPARIAVLELLTAQAAISFENARLYSELSRSEALLSEGQRLSLTGSFGWNVSNGELFWSDETFRILGFDPATKPSLEAVFSRSHPDDIALLKQTLYRTTRDGTNLDFEHRLLLPDGTIKHVHVVAHAADGRDGKEFVGAVMDVTAAHQARTDLEQAFSKLVRSEGFLAEGQRLSSTGTFSWRIDTDEVLFSEELNRIFEFERNSAVTLEQIGARVHPEDIELLSTTIERSRNGEGNFDYDIRLRMPDGRIKYLHTLSHTMRHQDGRLESLGAVQDITQRRLSEEALDKVQTELAHVSRMTTLGELTASIAHEVNQPLGSVVNNANACLSFLSNDTHQLEEVREALAEIVEGADRASAVISRVRQLSKKAPYERTLVSLKDVIADVLALADNEAVRREVTINTDMADELPSILGDRIQLQQVLLNLAVNGMDAMSNVEPAKRILTISGRCETREGKPEALVSVQDIGTGLKAGEMDRLFEAFYSTKPEGMGMGLAISRSIIEAHGGRLWAESNQGAGATFLFCLPTAHQDKS